MTHERLKEIEARCEAATAGPWADLGGIAPYDCVVSVATGVTPICVDPEMDDRPEDRAFIAHARDDVPEVVAEVRRLRADRKAIRAEIVRYRDANTNGILFVQGRADAAAFILAFIDTLETP